MKFLFIVQGEGRGHLTQAISLKGMLENAGHQIVDVLVGESKQRRLPSFFLNGIKMPVVSFKSPNFLPSAKGKGPDVGKTLVYNMFKIPVYLKSILLIRKQIKETAADVVINFYDLLGSIAYTLFPPRAPLVCIAHQYLFLHPEFQFPNKQKIRIYFLKFFTKATCWNASKILALSFRAMHPIKKIVVIPPLLRKEVLEIDPVPGNYIHGYILNDAFSEEIIQYHNDNPSVDMHFFWDKKNVASSLTVSKGLTFHTLDDKLFIKYMANSMAYATTAGFESICEALYLRKPILMVPAHTEQECNAFDASLSGAGVISDHFDISKLINHIPNYAPCENFQDWVSQSDRIILTELEQLSQNS